MSVNRVADFGVTNTVLDADKIIEPENMTPDMRLVTLNNGEVVFINSQEEYMQYVAAGLLVGSGK